MIGRQMLACVALGTAFGAGCGDDSRENLNFPQTLGYGPGGVVLFTPPDSNGSGGGIVGDWFQCRDPQCSRLRAEGLRFTEDNRIVVLDARGSSLESDEAYCEQGQIGTYTYDGSTLFVSTIDNRKDSASFLINGNVAVLRESDDELTFFGRVDPPRSLGVCDRVVNIEITDTPPTTRPGG